MIPLQDCRLNLHILMTQTPAGYYAPLLLSKESVPGLIIAHGKKDSACARVWAWWLVSILSLLGTRVCGVLLTQTRTLNKPPSYANNRARELFLPPPLSSPRNNSTCRFQRCKRASSNTHPPGNTATEALIIDRSFALISSFSVLVA